MFPFPAQGLRLIRNFTCAELFLMAPEFVQQHFRSIRYETNKSKSSRSSQYHTNHLYNMYTHIYILEGLLSDFIKIKLKFPLHCNYTYNCGKSVISGIF